eukprot:1960303-Alexandrium_andersonii.AAC.1
MSASLVGSEMCIRDSSLSRGEGPPPGRTPQRGSARSCLRHAALAAMKALCSARPSTAVPQGAREKPPCAREE